PGRIARAEKAEQVRNTPAWAYFFAALCGVIPVFTLGGIVPIAVGVGGVTGCLAVGRASSVPTAFRVLTCLFIVGGCWGGTLLFLMLLLKSRRHRWGKSSCLFQKGCDHGAASGVGLSARCGFGRVVHDAPPSRHDPPRPRLFTALHAATGPPDC